MKIRLLIWVVCCTMLLVGCASAKYHFAKPDDIARIDLPKETMRGLAKSPCNNPESYAPDPEHPDHTPLRYLRVCFHFMNTADSSMNFYGDDAIQRTKELLDCMNQILIDNVKLRLPTDNDIPVLPVRYQYVLTPATDDPDDTGVYSHFNDTAAIFVTRGKHANNYSSSMTNSYALKRDSILNIFVMSHHRDSLKSKTYFASITGISIGGVVKVVHWFHTQYPNCNYKGTFNHEVGHFLGLGHAWTRDGCSDTPEHVRKCYSPTDAPECDTLVSNNVMDYNIWQEAYSPCQIGTMHLKMATEGSTQRKKLVADWCELDRSKTIRINSDIHWQSAKDLKGNIIVQSGGTLTLSCRLSLPQDATITVQPGGTLVLDNCRIHNSCGGTWRGIEIGEQGGRRGKITIIGAPVIENATNSFDLLQTDLK